MKENILQVNNRNEFRQWLSLHSSKETECWIKVKRGRPISPDVFYYLDTVEEALCFGWIDSTHAVLTEYGCRDFHQEKRKARGQS